MQPPKEQHLKFTGMDTEAPLLVLKCSPFKILLRVLFWLIALPICLLLFSLFDLQISDVLFVAVFFMIFIFVITMIAKALVTKSFKLYPDRIEKHYIFWKRTMYLKNADIVITLGSGSWLFLGGLSSKNRYPGKNTTIYVEPKGNYFCRLWNRMAYDVDLGYRKDVDFNSFINCCKSIGIEFIKRNYFTLTEKNIEEIEVNSRSQYLRPIKTDNNSALLVLKYAPMEVFRSFVLYNIPLGIFICYLCFYFLCYVRMGRGRDLFFFGAVLCVVFCGLLIYLIIASIDMLFMESFELYVDRVERCYGFCGVKFGKRVLFLKDVYISVFDGGWKRICIIPKDKNVGRCFSILSYDVNLGVNKPSDVDDFICCCKSIEFEFLKINNFIIDKEYYRAVEREDEMLSM